jgi:hypothetical protein
MYYSYRRNPTGREFFVPAGTLIAVKLLINYHKSYYVQFGQIMVFLILVARKYRSSAFSHKPKSSRHISMDPKKAEASCDIC